MAYKPISPQGKKFITNTINKDSKLFTGSKLKYSKQQYFDLLILWIEKYSKLYDLDANILSAQIHQESKFRPGAYNKIKATGNINAMGITQFLLITVNDVLLGRFKNEFTSTETDLIIDKITLNSKGFIPSAKRPQLLENIANNPEIMIKAQAVYMKKAIADRIKSDLASVCLYCYNRGPGFIQETYGDTIVKYLSKNLDPKIQKQPITDPATYRTPPTEGTDYVKKIFDLLKSYFGYTDLDNTIDYDKLGFGNK